MRFSSGFHLDEFGYKKLLQLDENQIFISTRIFQHFSGLQTTLIY